MQFGRLKSPLIWCLQAEDSGKWVQFQFKSQRPKNYENWWPKTETKIPNFFLKERSSSLVLISHIFCNNFSSVTLWSMVLDLLTTMNFKNRSIFNLNKCGNRFTPKRVINVAILQMLIWCAVFMLYLDIWFCN